MAALSLSIPRVAYCTDTFGEINGVATVSQQFQAYAQRRGLPWMIVRPGPETRAFTEGSVEIVELAKSPFCLPLDMGLRFDLLQWRHAPWLAKQFQRFRADVIHVTGPGDIGMLAAKISHRLPTATGLVKTPLVASWHTNLHQYARMRCSGWMPRRMDSLVGGLIERGSFRAAARFYQLARLTLAPNPEVLDDLCRCTHKPGFVMPHGVDTFRFKPRIPQPHTGPVVLGYVGRLTPEKNVRFLAEVAAKLPPGSFKFLIVGDGSEREWLEKAIPQAEFRGILRGAELAAAYAEMDVFLFPSHSDTFGLVILEAMASAVPVVTFQQSGPCVAVRDGETGFTAACPDLFAQRVTQLIENTSLRESLAQEAQRQSSKFSWDTVFEAVYESYASLVPTGSTWAPALAT
ncbi:MAG: glycosyltransferase [Acidobacteria bacterium]|nr:glycosyltransferase [Acidobacteriota bacterium]